MKHGSRAGFLALPDTAVDGMISYSAAIDDPALASADCGVVDTSEAALRVISSVRIERA